MSKIKLDEQAYQGLSQLMSSGDDDITLALQTLEKCDFNGSLCYILMLFKTSPVLPIQWKKETQTLWAKLRGMGVTDQGVLTINLIMKKLANQKCGLEQQQFVLDQYSKNMLKQLHKWGYEQAKDVQIKIMTYGKTNQGREPVQGE